MLFHKCECSDETVCNQQRPDYLEKIKFSQLCSTKRNLIHRVEIEISILKCIAIGFVYSNYDINYLPVRYRRFDESNSRHNFDTHISIIHSTFACSTFATECIAI